MKIGTRVKYSFHGLENARDWWIRQGEPTRKERARAAYEIRKALRGTVVGYAEPVVTVAWEDNSVSQSLPHWVEAIPSSDNTGLGEKK